MVCNPVIDRAVGGHPVQLCASVGRGAPAKFFPNEKGPTLGERVEPKVESVLTVLTELTQLIPEHHRRVVDSREFRHQESRTGPPSRREIARMFEERVSTG